MLQSLFQNWDIVKKSQNEVADSMGLTTDRYQIYMEGLEATTNKFKAAWEELWMKTIASDSIKATIKFGTAIVELVTRLGGIIPVLTTIIGLIVILQKNVIAAKAISAIDKITASMNKLKMVTVMTEAEMKASNAAMATSWIGIAIMIVGAIWSIIEAIPTLDERIQSSIDKLNEYSDTVKSLRESKDSVKELWEEMDKLNAQSSLTSDEQERLRDIQNELKEIVPQLAGAYDDEGNFLIDVNAVMVTYIGLLQDEIEKKQELIRLEAEETVDDSVKKYEKESEKLQSLIEQQEAYTKAKAEYDAMTYLEIAANKVQMPMSLVDEKQIAEQKAVVDETAKALEELYYKVGEESQDSIEKSLRAMGKWNDSILNIANNADDTVTPVEELAKSFEQLADASEKSYKSLESSITSLASIEKSYNDNGEITLAQASQMIDLGYAEALMIDTKTGKLGINMQIVRQLIIENANLAASDAQKAYASAISEKQTDKEVAALYKKWQVTKAIADNLSSLPQANFSLASYASGVSSATSATNKLTDAKKAAYEAEIKGYEAQKKALDNQKKDLEKQKDAYKDIIDAMKEKLRIQKETDDYNSELEDKNKELADIDKELLELQFDNSEEAKAKRLQLEADKAEKIEEITQFQADRTYDIQMDALDAEYEAYAKMIDQQLAGIDSMIAGFDAMISKINEMIDALGKLASAGGGGGASSSPTTTQHGKRWISTGYIPETHIVLPNGQIQTSGGKDSGYWQYYHNGGIVESHHDGGFAGGIKPNEVFSKLLKGEYVSTEAQMKNFLSDILPKMMIGSNSMIQNKSGGGDISITMPITIEGNADESLLPKIKNMVSEVIYEGMKNKGYRRNVNSYGNV